ncbi:MAG: hypothetical protein JKY17_01955 [Magnetovibrio sp.]|nr:hypothetical protein [Magnetovibrio sp.]
MGMHKGKKMYFSNNQWSVTDKGLETIHPAPQYFIDKGRLTETSGLEQGTIYVWPAQLAEKTWVDIEAFIEAYIKALEIHEGHYSPALDSSMLETSLKTVRRT